MFPAREPNFKETTVSQFWNRLHDSDFAELGYNSSFTHVEDEMAEWAYREYTKGEIDRAGELLAPWWHTGVPHAELGKAFVIIENWRSSHAFPLNTFQVRLRHRAKKVEDNVLVAQRLKRFLGYLRVRRESV
jgi:hypothetical protein